VKEPRGTADTSEDGFELRAEDLRVLGEICRRYAVLAAAVSRCIGRLVSTDPTVGDILSARGYLTQMLGVLGLLVRYRYGVSETSREAAEAIALAEAAVRHRNQIVHSPCLATAPGRDAVAAREDRREESRPTGAPVRCGGEVLERSDLTATVRELEDAAEAMRNLETRLDAASVADRAWWTGLTGADDDGTPDGSR